MHIRKKDRITYVLNVMRSMCKTGIRVLYHKNTRITRQEYAYFTTGICMS